MRLLILLLLSVFISAPTIAGYELDRFELAKQAHMEKKFSEAIILLEKEIKVQPNNASVYFNMGLAYKAEKRFPEAIWAFEKTLKLNPKDSESIQLIESSYKEMDHKLEWKDETGTFQRSLIALGSNFWSLLAILCSFISALAVIPIIRTKHKSNRKWYVGATVFGITTFILCFSTARSAYYYEHNSDYGIALEEIKLQPPNSPKEEVGQLTYFPGRKVKVEEWHKDGSATVIAFGKKMNVKKGLARI